MRLEATSFPHIARLVEAELDRMTQPEPAGALPENPTLDAARGVIGPSIPPPVLLKTATEGGRSTLLPMQSLLAWAAVCGRCFVLFP